MCIYLSNVCTLNSDLNNLSNLLKVETRYLTSAGAVPAQLTRVIGNRYDCDFEIYNIPSGYRLLFAHFFTAWNSSHEWMDYSIFNPFVTYTSGKLSIYVKDNSEENITLHATISSFCVFVKI